MNQAKKILMKFLIIVFLFHACKDDITSPPKKSLYTSRLEGEVKLENQTEHSNALVYLDSLNRGVSTDSSGYYSFQFTEQDSTYSGIFKVYYFVNEFELDSAHYFLEDGKVRLDSLDVNAEGDLPTKELEQLILVEGWTDKQEYRIGDSITFKARFTNVSARTVHLSIYSFFGPFGHVFLYNENYPSFFLTPIIDTFTNFDLHLSAGNYYEGQVIYTVPTGTQYNMGWLPLPPEDYIVVTDLHIEERREHPFKNEFEEFVSREWYKLHRGRSPKWDDFPNKYKFPIIKIIE